MFAKQYLTALRIISNTVNGSNKHNNNSKVLQGTSALNVKSRTFYNNYGCNTKKMKYHGCNTKVHTKNMDFSNIIISVTWYMARDLILYFITVWPSPDLFSQDKKWTSAEIVFISKFLVKTTEVNFSFFTFSR